MKWLFLAFVISILASCTSYRETLKDQNDHAINTMSPDRGSDADESADSDSGDAGDAEGGDGDSGQ